MRSWSDSGIKISDLYQVVVLYFYGDRGGVRREFAREVADFPPIGRRTITGTSPMARAARGSIGTRQFLWARFLRTGLVCTTCTGMSGNGSRTAGTTATRGLRRTGAHGRRAESAAGAVCAAGPGATFRGSFAPRTAAGTPPDTAATISGFVYPGRSPRDSLPHYLRSPGAEPLVESALVLRGRQRGCADAAVYGEAA